MKKPDADPTPRRAQLLKALIAVVACAVIFWSANRIWTDFFYFLDRTAVR